jgi:hypothetical protein
LSADDAGWLGFSGIVVGLVVLDSEATHRPLLTEHKYGLRGYVHISAL